MLDDVCVLLTYYNGRNVPMGTIATNNNARVWNEQSNTIMAFRQPDNNVTVTNNDIATSGTVNVYNGNTLDMRTGNSITLEPGFSVELGAEFSATIENIYDCGIVPSPAPKIMIQNVPEENDDTKDIFFKDSLNFSYTVYPDHTDEFINITYSLDTDMFLIIELEK